MNTDEKRRARYFTIANIVLFLLGALIIAIGFITSPNPPDLNSILFNIGSNIVVISLVFFFGKLLLADPQRDVEEALARIEAKVNTRSNSFITKGELADDFPFDKFIYQTKDLLLGGVGLRMTVGLCRDDLIQRLREGARLRFAVLNPDSPDVEDMALKFGIEAEHIRTSIRNTLANLDHLRMFVSSNKSSSVEIRLLKSAPTISFALRDPGKPHSMLHISFRLSSADTRKHPSQILTPTDRWYAVFQKECETLWRDGQSWPVASQGVKLITATSETNKT